MTTDTATTTPTMTSLSAAIERIEKDLARVLGSREQTEEK